MYKNCVSHLSAVGLARRGQEGEAGAHRLWCGLRGGAVEEGEGRAGLAHRLRGGGLVEEGEPRGHGHLRLCVRSGVAGDVVRLVGVGERHSSEETALCALLARRDERERGSAALRSGGLLHQRGIVGSRDRRRRRARLVGFVAEEGKHSLLSKRRRDGF